MSDNFLTLVIKMREAQKAFFEHKRRGDMMEAVKWEARVDAYIQNYVADQVQLELWSRLMKSSEMPGAYNVTDEIETEEGGVS